MESPSQAWRPLRTGPHSPLHVYFQLSLHSPPLKLFFLLLFSCFHMLVSVSCEASLRKRQAAKEAQCTSPQALGAGSATWPPAWPLPPLRGPWPGAGCPVRPAASQAQSASVAWVAESRKTSKRK